MQRSTQDSASYEPSFWLVSATFRCRLFRWLLSNLGCAGILIIALFYNQRLCAQSVDLPADTAPVTVDTLRPVGAVNTPPAGEDKAGRQQYIAFQQELALTRALTQRGSIVFRSAPLAEVILILSDQWDVNIVAGAEIDGTISGTFKNETLEKILDSVLTANGYGYQRIGNSLVVRPAAQGGGSKPSHQVAVIDVPPAQVEQLDELMEALKLQMSPDGQLQSIKSSGKIAVSDTPERIQAVRLLLEQITGPGLQHPHPVSTQPHANDNGRPSAANPPAAQPGLLELRPQYVDAKDLEAPLQMILGSATLATIETENIIVVVGDPSSLERARLMVQQLDRPRPQVRITGYIYDVDLADIERLGVDWNSRKFSQAIGPNGVPRNLAISQSGLLVPNVGVDPAAVASGVVDTAVAGTAAGTASATAAAASGGQFLFRTLNSHYELQALIQALDLSDGSRLLADPHVTVVDRHQASLGIVTEIPIQQLTQTQQGGAIGTTTFREAGITLDVIPRISADGTIEMEVTPEYSVLAGYQDGNPIIDARRATTVVRVAHGQALVIGGLRSKTVVETINGIPGLMNIKYLGALFKTHSTNVRESELLVFIMPEIVGYCGGLEREMEALEVERRQLSRVTTAVDGPFSPNCGDKHCPQHCERPHIHNGMQDTGLVGGYDGVFVNPLPSMMVLPGPAFAPESVQPPPIDSDASALPENAIVDPPYS